MNLITFAARCLEPDCEHGYNENLADATPGQKRSQLVNRELWAKTHYEVHGHHRFMLAETTAYEITVAEIHDPNQGRLQDDENFATEHIGPTA